MTGWDRISGISSRPSSSSREASRSKRTAATPELSGKILTQLADAMAQKKMPPADLMASLTDFQKKTYPTAPPPPAERGTDSRGHVPGRGGGASARHWRMDDGEWGFRLRDHVRPATENSGVSKHQESRGDLFAHRRLAEGEVGDSGFSPAGRCGDAGDEVRGEVWAGGFTANAGLTGGAAGTGDHGGRDPGKGLV